MSEYPPSFSPKERRSRPLSQAAQNAPERSESSASSRLLTPGEQARVERESHGPRPHPSASSTQFTGSSQALAPSQSSASASARPSRSTASEARSTGSQHPSAASQASPNARNGAESSPRPKRPSAQGARRTQEPSNQGGQMPVFRTRPRVYGIAADDAQARAWRVDSASPEPQADRPLLPTTADQPQRDLPPAFAPKRKSLRQGASPQARAQAEGFSHERQQPRPTTLTPRRGPSQAPHSAPRPRLKRARRLRGRLFKVFLLLVLILSGWVGFLMWDANQNLGRTSALSGAADTPGTTYLLAGSDSRDDGAVQDDFEGSERSDSIMLVNIAPNGQKSAVSIPRDTYVEIPGYGWDKINASFSYGGPELLVKTVESLSGLTVDHYVQIGMGGVSNMVDAVDGINVCYDGNVRNDPSTLEWTAGCHDVDGKTALAFSRMRYQDPEGDIGRAKRQRQVVSKTIEKALAPTTFLYPARTLRVERAGSGSFTVDEDTSLLDIARLVLAFKDAGTQGLSGIPPIESLDFRTDVGTSAVLLEDETAPEFFEKLRNGTLTTEDFNAFGR